LIEDEGTCHTEEIFAEENDPKYIDFSANAGPAHLYSIGYTTGSGMRGAAPTHRMVAAVLCFQQLSMQISYVKPIHSCLSPETPSQKTPKSQ
jgi:hypothetical protein